jgi:drug/metabolite transporter (DMT)-like permease
MGDFSGGMAVRRSGGSLGAALRVILLSHLTSFVILILLAFARGDAFPHGAPLLWGLMAGVCGGISLTAFYVALARGAMGAPAAISGLLAAAIPALVDMASEGAPGWRHGLGFLIAGAAIWLIAGGSDATPDNQPTDRTALLLAIFAGAGFGCYFVSLKFAGAAGLIWPMATARIGSITTCSVLLLFLLGKGEPIKVAIDRTAVRWLLSTALFDTTGNLLFIAATHAGRLDVAAVLASLYPASTILLAAAVVKEKPTRLQGVGMGIAALAVCLITL